jgi:hypothetical protein
LPESAIPTYAVSLVLRPGGWRVFVSPSPEGESEGEPVTIAQAEEIARAVTEATGADKQVTPYMVVRNGTTQLRSSLEAALAEAESKAQSIPGLRRALGEIGAAS